MTSNDINKQREEQKKEDHVRKVEPDWLCSIGEQIHHIAYHFNKTLKKHDIIAVGDGLNDISMLDGSITKNVGCPLNASEEVKHAVCNAGGIIAKQECAEGTLEIIKDYLDN